MTIQAPQPVDVLFQSYGRNLYKITGEEGTDNIMDILSADAGANNSTNVQTSMSDLGSGVMAATTVQAGGSIQQGKSTFDNTTTGFILGMDSKVGLAKFYIGSPSVYLNWDGATLTTNGTITGGSLAIGSNATIDSSGNATFIGVSSINKKAYTNFESSGRFISVVGGTGANTFGNQGVTVSPGATSTSYSKLLWKIGNVFTNNPTFTITIYANSLHQASGTSRCFFGMGQPTVAGTGITYTSLSFIGFVINKDSNVVNVGSACNDGNVDGGVGANFTTIADTDVLEVFIKVTATSVKWYYRKNGGAIALGDTQTTRIPSSTDEDTILFATSNAGTAVDFSLIVQCAAYEH